jgi:hypothetical protein
VKQNLNQTSPTPTVVPGASGTPEYDASADRVAGLLQAAGFVVERQVFDFSLPEPRR